MAFLGIAWGFYNIFSCTGWAATKGGMALGSVASLDIGGPCSMAKLGMVFLFLIIAVVRKWGGEEIDVPFSFMWSMILGMGLYFLAITFTGSFKAAMLVGLIAALAAGYGSGYIMGEENVGGDYE
jgi:drug/metabolite transporter (DMT)-like permease